MPLDFHCFLAYREGCPELRDVIYGQPLMLKIVSFDFYSLQMIFLFYFSAVSLASIFPFILPNAWILKGYRVLSLFSLIRFVCASPLQLEYPISAEIYERNRVRYSYLELLFPKKPVRRRFMVR